MSAPNVTYRIATNRISDEAGKDSLSVSFSADEAYASFECRATKAGENWGVGVGELLASFSQTPAYTERTFEIYDDYLLKGDGDYRISLYVQGVDGSWNDNQPFVPAGSALMFAGGQLFLSRR